MRQGEEGRLQNPSATLENRVSGANYPVGWRNDVFKITLSSESPLEIWHLSPQMIMVFVYLQKGAFDGTFICSIKGCELRWGGEGRQDQTGSRGQQAEAAVAHCWLLPGVGRHHGPGALPCVCTIHTSSHPFLFTGIHVVFLDSANCG